MRANAGTKRLWAYLTWPNRITLLRLLLVVPLVVLIQYQQRLPACRYLALGIFVFLAFSDFADGFLARRLRCQSLLGAILDALADKALIIWSAVLLSLPDSWVPQTRLPGWVVVFIVGKDLWVMVGFALVFLLTGRIHVRPVLPGKLCTAAQLAMVSVILISPDLNRLGLPIGTLLATGLWWAVTGLAVVSVIAYTRMGLGMVMAADHEAPGQRGGDAGKPR